jgi:hypothetical protein
MRPGESAYADAAHTAVVPEAAKGGYPGPIDQNVLRYGSRLARFALGRDDSGG